MKNNHEWATVGCLRDKNSGEILQEIWQDSARVLGKQRRSQIFMVLQNVNYSCYFIGVGKLFTQRAKLLVFYILWCHPVSITTIQLCYFNPKVAISNIYVNKCSDVLIKLYRLQNWISYHFHMSQNIIILLNFLSHLKLFRKHF